MQRLFYWLIEAVYWLAIFLSSVLLFGAIGLIMYASDPDKLPLSLLVLFTGVALGVLWAEKIRRTYGCSAYIGNILATPDIWPIPDKAADTLASDFLFQCKANYLANIRPNDPKSKTTEGYAALLQIANTYFQQGRIAEFAGFFQESQYLVNLWVAVLILEYGNPNRTLREEAEEIVKRYSA